MRMAHAAIGYAASALDSKTEAYANVARSRSMPYGVHRDVRAGRQIKVAFPSPALTRSDPSAYHDHRRHFDTLRSGRLRTALVDVCAGWLRREPEKWSTLGVYARTKLLDGFVRKSTAALSSTAVSAESRAAASSA
jgi:hypothetical protein